MLRLVSRSAMSSSRLSAPVRECIRKLRISPSHVALCEEAATAGSFTVTSGLAATSYAKCEDIRAILPHRLRHKFGEVDAMVMVRIHTLLRRLLDL
jgi:mRNA-degrading endonuclease toxin of MazEF toxin-antitoxin module